MAQLSFDAQHLGRLARRDLERACGVCLEGGLHGLADTLLALQACPPLEWPADLLPFLSWLQESIREEGGPPEETVRRLLRPHCIIRSPLHLVEKPLQPGDEISEVLTRRLGRILLNVGGEGDRLVSLDSSQLLMGSELGYFSSSADAVRAKRMSAAEQTSIQKAWALLKSLENQRETGDPMLEGLKLRFERLLVAPNQHLPATLAWLEGLSLEARRAVWQAVVEYQRRMAFPAERRPAYSWLINQLEKLGLHSEVTHLSRLQALAARALEQLTPDPDVAAGLTQLELSGLEEYLGWEPTVTALPRYRSAGGVQLLNLALLLLQAGKRSPSWPSALESELIELRESYLKPMLARPAFQVLALDPLELIRQALRQNQATLYPRCGEPTRLLALWSELEAELKALAGVESEPPGASPVPPTDEDEYASAEDFFSLSGNSILTMSAPQGEPTAPASPRPTRSPETPPPPPPVSDQELSGSVSQAEEPARVKDASGASSSVWTQVRRDTPLPIPAAALQGLYAEAPVSKADSGSSRTQGPAAPSPAVGHAGVAAGVSGPGSAAGGGMGATGKEGAGEAGAESGDSDEQDAGQQSLLGLLPMPEDESISLSPAALDPLSATGTASSPPRTPVLAPKGVKAEEPGILSAQELELISRELSRVVQVLENVGSPDENGPGALPSWMTAPTPRGPSLPSLDAPQELRPSRESLLAALAALESPGDQQGRDWATPSEDDKLEEKHG